MRLAIVGTILLAAAFVVVGTAQQPAAPQPPVRRDAAISGVVIDGVTKQPVEDAVVQLSGPQQRDFPEYGRPQFADSKGRFVFTDLPAGSGYLIVANKTGYFQNAFGSIGDEAWTSQAISVNDGQWVSTANVTLWPPASISGTVVDERGEPVIGVFVRLVAAIRIAGADQWAVGDVTLTDDRGMYRIGRLHPGRYLVMVPSVQAAVPASTTSASTVGLDPVDLASLQKGERPQMASLPTLVDIDSRTRLLVRGYPVPPPPVDGRSLTYPIAFAGSTSIAQARPVIVIAGENRAGVDVRLEPVPAVRVSGVLDGPPDARSNQALRLIADGLEDLGWGAEAATTVSGPDGSFTFANVPAGRYTIEAPLNFSQYTIGNRDPFYMPQLPRPPAVRGSGQMGDIIDAVPGFTFEGANAAPGMWARTVVPVGTRDELGIVVTLQPTIRISGKLVSEADPSRPAPSAAPRFVALRSATGSPRLGAPESVFVRNVAAGEFAIDGIVPGQYFLRGNDTGWMVKSVVAGGRDVTYAPIEIAVGTSLTDIVVTSTNAIPILTGVVSTEAGTPSQSAAVIAFPAEREQWTNYGMNPARIKSVQASTNGSFRFTTLPAGSYYVVAVPAARLNAWREPDFFKQAQPLATRITIGWGGQKTVDLRVSSVR